MPYTHDISGCFTESGIAESAFNATLKKAHANRKLVDEAMRPFLDAIANRKAHEETAKFAADIRGKFRHLVILGTGGSALCGHALTGTAELASRHSGSTQLHYMDNVDPHSVACLFSVVKPEEAFFLVISKSGGTLETLVQLTRCLQEAQKSIAANLLKYHFLCVSDPKESALRNIAAQFSIPVIEHEPEVGGRFAIFTNVGLLPAAVAGLDITAIFKGTESALASDAPYEGAALQTIWMAKGLRTHVLMPYLDRLWHFTSWVRQVWAESLGKSGHGSTPIRAAGTVDQHSQLQLYLDGPRDKYFTLIQLARHESADPKLEGSFLTANGLDYIERRTLGDVLNASCDATRQTFLNNAVPVRSMTLETLDEASLGALAMHFMLETVIAASLLGLDAFDQPAVEQGKVLARKALKELP